MKLSTLALAGAAVAAFGALVSPQALLAAPAGPDGSTLFRQRCVMCHSNVAGRPSPLGPNLVGVVGRKAGSTTFNHSPAMKASRVTWNAANLDRYLLSPPRMVPGSKMTIAVPNAAERAALVRYLATLR